MPTKAHSISQAAEMLSLSKDTLRYYDKQGLVKPTRGENGYRFYTGFDILLLKYVEVMKFAGLSLSQIGAVLYDVAGQEDANKIHTLNLLREKRDELKQKITVYQALERLMDQVIQDLGPMDCPADMAKVDDMVNSIYAKLRGNDLLEQFME